MTKSARAATAAPVVPALLLTRAAEWSGQGAEASARMRNRMARGLRYMLLCLIVSPLWLRFFLFGPLEWMWRSLTYWKLQPFVRRG